MIGFRNQHRQLMPYVIATLLTTSAFFLVIVIFAGQPVQEIGFHARRWRRPHSLCGKLLDGDPSHRPLSGLRGHGRALCLCRGRSGRQTAWQHLDSLDSPLDACPWLFLSLGIPMGSQWAYIELGWGGYWAWDAVENASLLPWLTVQPFSIPLSIQERRGMLKVWNLVLVFLTYELVLIGTFITRSGVIESVHAFALSNVGPLFLGFIALSIFGFLWLLLDRLPLLRSDNELDSMLSRESGFLFNNVVFVGIVFATFFGTTFPMFSELLTGNKISVAVLLVQ